MASKMNIDITSLVERLRRDFTALDPNDPSQWPAVPKNLLYITVCALVVIFLWFFWLKDVDERLESERARETQLKQVYREKLVKAVNLDELKKQLEQVQQYVTQLEKQLPSKAEMDALLSDINQAGLGRSLQFELFRPGQVVVKNYYAELPITVRITGAYHDMGLFASDIANLSRIVTLNDLTIVPIKERDGVLVMNGVAKTFRYLDPSEVQQQAAIAGGAQAGGAQ